MKSPLKFIAPHGVHFKDGLGSRHLELLQNGKLIASFDVAVWGGDEGAWEAAWNHLYGPNNELIAQGIARDVAELPDRTSPDDQPDMMLVSAKELEAIVLAYLNR